MSEKKFLIQGNLSLQSAYELEHSLMLKDRWHGEKDLGMRVNKHIKSSTIYFGGISQDWFKTTAKHFILSEQMQGKSFGTLQQHTRYLQYFAQFLENKCVYSFSEITVEILSAYLEKLHSFSPKTRNGRLGAVKAFFDLGTMNGWFDISTYWFNGRMPQVKPNKIDYIPQEVLRQLDEHLCLLPEQLQRMVILIRTLGLRACEILQMQFDCLRQRKNGKWEVHFINWKFNEKPDIIKCVPEIADIIKEQQAYIRKNLGEEFKYLFCGNARRGRIMGFKPSHKIMSLASFSHYLNQLAQDCNICDQTGKQWRFKSHQFRRTIATTMTNAGVRQYIIQCYLRHLDPNMMQHYAHVLPETEKKEIEKLHKQKKIVDITGAEVNINHPELENDLGLQWLRSKMQPKALAMGFCARPQLLKPCPHANACMSCGHFRLDEDDLPALKQHLDRNRQLKVESERLGYIRQLKGIEEDEAQLIQLVQSLQENNE